MRTSSESRENLLLGASLSFFSRFFLIVMQFLARQLECKLSALSCSLLSAEKGAPGGWGRGKETNSTREEFQGTVRCEMSGSHNLTRLQALVRLIEPSWPQQAPGQAVHVRFVSPKLCCAAGVCRLGSCRAPGQARGRPCSRVRFPLQRFDLYQRSTVLRR